MLPHFYYNTHKSIYMEKKATIIVVGGIKGGPGKTTIAVNLAIWLDRHGKSTLLIDSDDQQSATDFTVERSKTWDGKTGYTMVNITSENIRDQVINLSFKYDYIVIDCAGRDTTTQRSALSIANIFLAPIKPRGSFDFWPFNSVAKLVGLVKALNPTLRAFSFLSQADTISQDNRDVAEGLRGFQEQIEFIDCQVTYRKSFAHSTMDGLSIFEYMDVKNPELHRDPKAVKEMDDLFTAIVTANNIIL
jgi:chromosome partitioning protein